MVSLQEHIRQLRIREFDAKMAKPKCAIKGCKGRVCSGRYFGKPWQSKYCKTHNKIKRKYAIKNKQTPIAGNL